MTPKYTPPPWHTAGMDHPVEANIVAENGRIVCRGVYHEDAERICLAMNGYDRLLEDGLAKGSLMDAIRQFLEAHTIGDGIRTGLGVEYLRRAYDKFKK